MKNATVFSENACPSATPSNAKNAMGTATAYQNAMVAKIVCLACVWIVALPVVGYSVVIQLRGSVTGVAIPLTATRVILQGMCAFGR